jgi:hypothetical protein
VHVVVVILPETVLCTRGSAPGAGIGINSPCNRVQFNPPAIRVDSSDFGVVSSQANSPRQVQVSVKLIF